MAPSRRAALSAKKSRTGNSTKSGGSGKRILDASTGQLVTSAGGTPGYRKGIVPGHLVQVAFPDVDEIDPVVLRRAFSETRSIQALGSAIAANPEPTSPELARSLQAEENWWRKIDEELPSLGSAETAAVMGAKPSNRNFASTQRAAGKLLGYRRRNAVRYPKFQFDSRGTVLPVIPDLIAVARELSVSDEDLVMWLASPTSLFAEQDRPVDHLDDPEGLLGAARDEFGAEW